MSSKKLTSTKMHDHTFFITQQEYIKELNFLKKELDYWNNEYHLSPNEVKLKKISSLKIEIDELHHFAHKNGIPDISNTTLSIKNLK
jgi:hypothetical protein